MGRSVQQIEQTIRADLAGCSLAARGLWIECRHWMTTGGRPGCLERDGRGMTVAELGAAAGVDEGTAAELFEQLRDAGLIKALGAVLYCDRLATIARKRSAAARRVRTHKQRKKTGVS